MRQIDFKIVQFLNFNLLLYISFLQHIEKVFKHKELEQQLVDAKLAQANLQMTEQKERDLKEKQIVSAYSISVPCNDNI